MMLGRAVLLGVTVLTWPVAARGVAPEPDPDPEVVARGYNREAIEAARRGDQEEALRGFERAFQINPDPRVRLNLGVACEALGRLDDAAAHYEAYLEACRDCDKVPQVTDRLEGVRRRMEVWGKVVVVTDPEGAEVRVAERRLGNTPPSTWLPVGAHAVVVAAPGRVEDRQVLLVKAGQRHVVQVTLAPEEAGTPVPGPPGTSVAQPPPSSRPGPTGPALVRWGLRGLGLALGASVVVPCAAGSAGAVLAASLWLVSASVVGTDPVRVPIRVAYATGLVVALASPVLVVVTLLLAAPPVVASFLVPD
jgi:hypothetical protein